MATAPCSARQHPPKTREDSEPWWQRWWLSATLVVLITLPLLWPSIPPLLDLPGHMGRYTVMLGRDPGLARWYDFQWKPIGYLGSDLLVAAIAPALGLEIAVKLIVVATAALTASGLLWLSREAHGRLQPLAIVALPLVYNFTFLSGYLNYTLAMALTLNAFALWLRLAGPAMRGMRAAWFVPIGCVIWITHMFGWIVLGVLVFSAEWSRCRGKRIGLARSTWRAGLSCWPLAVPGIMSLAWRPADAGAGDWQQLLLKPGWIATALRDRWMWLDIGSTVLIIILLYGTLRARGLAASRPVAAAALGLLLLFLILPPGAAFIDARLAPYLLMFGLLVPSTDHLDWRRQHILAAIALAFLLVRTAATTASLTLEAQDWNRRLAALDHLPRGARVVAFITNACPQSWHFGRLNHLPSMAIVRRGAFSNDQFDLGNSALLTVNTPGLGAYRFDPSQIVTNGPCADARGVGTIVEALGKLPRDQFDYIWLIDPPRGLAPNLVGRTASVWGDGRDSLLRIEH